MICPHCKKDKRQWAGDMCVECDEEGSAFGIAILGAVVMGILVAHLLIK